MAQNAVRGGPRVARRQSVTSTVTRPIRRPHRGCRHDPQNVVKDEELGCEEGCGGGVPCRVWCPCPRQTAAAQQVSTRCTWHTLCDSQRDEKERSDDDNRLPSPRHGSQLCHPALRIARPCSGRPLGASCSGRRLNAPNTPRWPNQPSTEQERLFKLGVDSGKRFIERIRKQDH